MNVRDTIITAIDTSGMSRYAVSKAMGKSPLYIGGLLSRGSVPKTDTMATIMDAAGYDLLVRRRSDGEEFIIDPTDEERVADE